MRTNHLATIDAKLDSIAVPLFQDGPDQALTTRMTHFDGVQFDPAWFELYRITCPDSVARSVRQRQREYFFGRLCARHALQAVESLDGMEFVQITSGFARQPLWPAGIVGSITHTASLAAAIVAPASAYAGIGIDIETLPSADGLEALAGTAVSIAELRLLRSMAGAGKLPLLITAVFSAKESFFKASFADVGHYFDFDAVSVRAIDIDAGVIELEQNLDLCPQLRAGARHWVRVGRLAPDTVCTLYARPVD